VNRRDQQYPRIGPLLIRTSFCFGEKLCKAYVTNLSLGGAFLATDEHIPQGHLLELTISLPWQLGQLDATATVIWRRPEVGADGKQSSGMGVQFAKLDEAAERKVEAYLNRFHDLAAQLPDLVS
jgi:uncharacterized protein (TIGR02266 family)